MLIQIEVQGRAYMVDTHQPLDISIPLRSGGQGPNCFYAPYFSVSPVVAGDFVGDTQQGGVVNFMDVRLNPHGNGTHTECLGHISKERHSINQCLREHFFLAELVSVFPERIGGDRIITRERLQAAFPGNGHQATACIIRSLPNDDSKCSRHYSGSNPPYIHHGAIQYLNGLGIQHLLTDLPSVDREEDGGQLLAHKAFWGYPEQPQSHKTITELIYVPDHIKDGTYLLNIQTAPFEMDASPSRPVLYRLVHGGN